MADYFSITKQKLKSVIKKMSNSPDSFVKNPQRDFSRKSRKISFQQTLEFVISLQGQCLDKELLRFYSHSPEVPSSSAMLQSRSKLAPSAFEHLFRSFSGLCKKGASFHGYQLLAADGSKFSFPENKKEPVCWGKNPNTKQGRNDC